MGGTHAIFLARVISWISSGVLIFFAPRLLVILLVVACVGGWWQRRRATIPLSTVKRVRGFNPRALRLSSFHSSRTYAQTETHDDAH